MTNIEIAGEEKVRFDIFYFDIRYENGQTYVSSCNAFCADQSRR